MEKEIYKALTNLIDIKGNSYPKIYDISVEDYFNSNIYDCLFPHDVNNIVILAKRHKHFKVETENFKKGLEFLFGTIDNLKTDDSDNHLSYFNFAIFVKNISDITKLNYLEVCKTKIGEAFYFLANEYNRVNTNKEKERNE